MRTTVALSLCLLTTGCTALSSPGSVGTNCAAFCLLTASSFIPDFEKREREACSEMLAAIGNGTHPALQLGMPIDDAMTCLEEKGFKRESTSGRADLNRPAFLYRRELSEPPCFIHVYEVWLYYEAGKLIDIKAPRPHCIGP